MTPDTLAWLLHARGSSSSWEMFHRRLEAVAVNAREPLVRHPGGVDTDLTLWDHAGRVAPRLLFEPAGHASVVGTSPLTML
jgi:hypothetical protein